MVGERTGGSIAGRAVDMMRAVVCEQHGSIDDLVLREIPTPEVRPGTVRLRVLAAGVDQLDHLIIGGTHQGSVATPFVPGNEFVGTIVDLADDVARDAPHLTLGARVLALSSGGFAEQAVVPAHAVTVVPDEIGDEQAATFAQSYLTAVFALRHRAGVERGETVLVVGAGSGAGLAAVDVAVSLHLRVVAVASTDEQRQLASDRGAETALDVHSDDIERDVLALMAADGRDGVDHVLDPVGGRRAETWLRCLGTGGQYLVVGLAAGATALPLDQVLLHNRRVTGVDWSGWMVRHPVENATLLNDLVRQVAIGRLRPVEPTAHPLERTVDALRDLAGRRVSGKLVVIP